MTEVIHTVGKQVSFAQLFGKFARVEIPIIQRDYAQGRQGHEELRKEFLAALKQALERPAEDPAIPLDLDFVYGSAFIVSSSEDETAFSPLDGQQRLTTLFLLHWYLAWRDGEGGDFSQRFMVGRRSRFSYEVRPSSHDFFNHLGLQFPSEKPATVTRLGAMIRDKAWFFQSWQNDPTIVSALTVLDEMHDMFRGCEEYYKRLTDQQSPRITFQLLELKHFGLSDDLYIKMNARGKPLTSFETFKARLEQHLDELLPNDRRSFGSTSVSIAEYFSHKMDTVWTDLFWGRRDPKTHLIDGEVMRLIKAVALVCLDPDDEQASKAVAELRMSGTNISFARMFDLKCLNPKMLQTLVAVLDYWSTDSLQGHPDKNPLAYSSRLAFERATAAELSYPELAKFAGFCVFIHSRSLPISQQECDSWLRIVVNLVNNSDIERPADFLDTLKSINHLTPHADRILLYVAEGGEVTAFNRQQVREERIKAALILRGAEWEDRILKAERHGYFQGQIEFLLQFSGILRHWESNSAILWSDTDDATAQAAFSDYFTKASAVFDYSGLRNFQESRWERALLAMGDYTIDFSKNRSFLQNKASSGERRPTWKLLLKGHLSDPVYEQKRRLVKAVLDRIDLKKGVEVSLEQVIRSAAITERWRQMMVQLPQMVGYCTQKMFRPLDDGSVYLISKVRTSSEHVELWSYFVHEAMFKDMASKNELSPFVPAYNTAITDEYVPSAVLTWRASRIEIDFVGTFRFAFRSNPSVAHQFLRAEVQRSFPFTAENDTWSFFFVSTDMEEVRRTITTIVAAARTFEQNAKEKAI